ncbi:hypothetical protein MNBD_BACTEROID03-2273 [hydrothermal vent metagenome]|uniref:Uncharacterized protein n=1 Tax=hydrothermal vent metagenome TaxID=652676 RepID=A0A3B0TF34_9ZZZZ
MALTYSLEIEDNIDISEIRKMLMTAPDFSEKNGEIQAVDLRVDITKTKGLSVLIIEDDFGFSPAISISFRLNKFAEPNALYKRFMQAVWAVLKVAKGDAVFLFNGESIILHRKKNRLYLNEIDCFWFESTLPIEQPYELKIMNII